MSDWKLDSTALKNAAGQAVQERKPFADAMLQGAKRPMSAIEDIAAERRRQIEIEGWDAAHDDEHESGSLATAGAVYCLNAADKIDDWTDYVLQKITAPTMWPWDARWWKPKNVRYDLVRAAALIVAEIERLDRAVLAEGAASIDSSVSNERPKGT
jgi:hypothetical protein